MGLQHTQPHSSAVPLSKAQTGNEKVPFEGSGQLGVVRYRPIKEFIKAMENEIYRTGYAIETSCFSSRQLREMKQKTHWLKEEINSIKY